MVLAYILFFISTGMKTVLYCFVFIHLYSASHSMSHSEALPITALILFRSLHAEALQATASEGLAQGPHVAARVGFEPATLRTEGTEPQQ